MVYFKRGYSSAKRRYSTMRGRVRAYPGGMRSSYQARARRARAFYARKKESSLSGMTLLLIGGGLLALWKFGIFEKLFPPKTAK